MTMADFRIRGNCGVIEEPEELKGKWTFEISWWNVEGTAQIPGFEPVVCKHAFDTEEEAAKEMELIIKESLDAMGMIGVSQKKRLDS